MTWILTLHLYFGNFASVMVVEEYASEHLCRRALMELVLKHSDDFDGDCYLEGEQTNE